MNKPNERFEWGEGDIEIEPPEKKQDTPKTQDTQTIKARGGVSVHVHYTPAPKPQPKK